MEAPSFDETLPFTQSRQLACSMPGWYFPLMHSTQPPLSTCCPTGHNEQETAPIFDVLPFGQSLQEVFCSKTSEKVLTGHEEQI